MIIHRDIEQGTEQWLKLRAGTPTSSEYNKIITTKGMPSKSRDGYLCELAGQRLSGVPGPHFQNAAMKWGNKYEPAARKMFQMQNEVEVEQVGFITSDCGRYGFSPDGLVVGKKEGTEFKCPILATQKDRIENGWELKTPYFQQVQGALLISGYDLWHAYSYFPGAQPVHVKVYRDVEFQRALYSELDRFCTDLDQLTERLKAA